jgi:hypothetical protein
MCELIAANRGYIEANSTDGSDDPMTRKEFEDLKERIGKNSKND